MKHYSFSCYTLKYYTVFCMTLSFGSYTSIQYHTYYNVFCTSRLSIYMALQSTFRIEYEVKKESLGYRRKKITITSTHLIHVNAISET